jgi:hypothetical protein
MMVARASAQREHGTARLEEAAMARCTAATRGPARGAAEVRCKHSTVGAAHALARGAAARSSYCQ